MNLDNTYLKYLIRSHTIIGVFVVFIFFISTYFGTITLFKPYIHTWENISRYFSIKKDLDLDKAINTALKKLENPKDNIQIELPSFRDKTLSVKYGFSEKVHINPNTNELIDISKDSYLISNFFNQMHISINLKRPGQILMGICSIVIIFLTFSGIYLWLVNRKKRVVSKGFWFKWHKDLSLIILPYILIFSMTGAVLGVMLVGSAPFALSATNGKESNMSKIVRPIVFSRPCNVKSSGEMAQMQSIDKLYNKAQEQYPNLKIKRIVLNAWNDKNACIAFIGFLKDNRALTGNSNRVGISFNAHTGEILNTKTLENSHSMAKVLSGFYFLHFLPDEGVFVRFLFLIFGFLFATSLVFGILIWLEKKASKFKTEKYYFNFLSKFSTAIFIGIVPASSFLLLLYWLLPTSINERDTWIIGGFFSFLSFSLFYSVYIQNTIKTIKSLMKFNALFLLLTVIFHGINSNYFIWESFNQALYEIFWIDLALLLFALFSLIIGTKMPKIKLLERI